MIHSDSSTLVKMVALLLRPIIRMLLRHGVTYPVFMELVKSSYVQVAEQVPAGEKSVTDSRISVQTGLNRKEVKRLRGLKPEDGLSTKFQQAGLGAQLVSTWLSQPDWLDENAQPRPLARLEADDQEKSFESLVRSITKDVHPRSILDDWLVRGFAYLDQQDRVHLNQTAYVPTQDQNEQLFFAQKNLTAHLNAVAHNLEADPVMFERSVYYNKLSRESIESLNDWSQQASMKLLTEFNLKAQALAKTDSSSDELYTAHLGVYLYRSDIDDLVPPKEGQS